MPEVALSVLPAFDEVFALLLTLDTIKPHPSLPKRLGPLLKDLQKPAPSRDPKVLAELVHALLITNRDSHAVELMAEAITHIDCGQAKSARILLDQLAPLQPNWPEVAYKQAITALMLGETERAVRHLGDTIQLEPRHFAALSLFGQICLDCDRLYEARIALQMAFDRNPHLNGVKETLLAIDTVLDPRDKRLNG